MRLAVDHDFVTKKSTQTFFCQVKSVTCDQSETFVMAEYFCNTLYILACAIGSHLLFSSSLTMPHYGKSWQSFKAFDDDLRAWLVDNADHTSTIFSAFAFFHQLNTHLETRNELLCEFSVAKVSYFKDGCVVRARLQPTVESDGQKFTFNKNQDKGERFCLFASTTYCNNKLCFAYLLVPRASLALTECAAILVRPHAHQRVSGHVQTRE